jgi:hypothetical protein
MHIAIIIVTHNSARHLTRVIEKLNNGCFDFYVHINKKVNAKHYQQALALPNVYLINNRVNVKQGGFSNLQATLNGINQILEAEVDYDFVSLISGREYPIKSADYICDFLKQNYGRQFIKFSKNWHNSNTETTEHYHLIDRDFFGKGLLEWCMNTLYKKPLPPKNLTIRGESAYWTISLSCARYVVTYMKRYRFADFLKYTKHSDRFAFQSIIMNSSYKDTVVNNDYRYLNQSGDRPHPKVLNVDDFAALITSDAHFARVFDINVEEKIFDMIDVANEMKN